MKSVTRKIERYYDAREDLQFSPEVYAAQHRQAPLFANLLMFFVMAFVAVFLFWASIATLDEVTRGDGRVIPSSQVQVIQNLEGGIVSEILAREGQIVEVGQVILKIDNRLAEADYNETYLRYLATKAAVTRLRAEIDGTELVFPDKVLEGAPAAVSNELAAFNVRKSQLDSQLSVLRSQVDQRRQEISELSSKRKNFQRSMDLANEQLDIIAPSVAKGVAPRIDLLNIQKEVNNLKSQMDSVRLSIPRAQSAMGEAKNRLQEREQSFRAEAQQELTAKENEMFSLEELIQADEDRVARTDVRSPVRGTVKDLKVNTIGGVVRPGEPLLEIVPLDDTLLIEARVRPSDIAFIRPDQNAKIKVTAYDFSIYGGLDGVVEDISADTITTEEGEEFYRVKLRTDKNFLGSEKDPLPIIAGMTAQVDILTGEKTVLQYLMKPLNKARQNALTER